MKAVKPIIAIVATVILVLVAQRLIRRTEPQQRFGGGAETTVAAEIVRKRPFADRTEAIGTVAANESVTVTPAVTERVAAIHFEDGEFVREGSLLVELEHDEETAALELARIDLAEQQRQFDRVTALHERDLVSQEDMALASDDLESAEARVAAAEARLSDRMITAPFDGVLGIRRVSPGSLVSPGSIITTLDDLSVVKVDFTVPEALLAQIAIGQSIVARSTAWPDELFRGRVTSIDSRVDPTTRAVDMQARIPNPDGRLRAGMLLTVELTCCPRETPGVPERALLSYADKQYVYRVRGDAARQTEVTLGVREAGFVEIEEGVSPGDTIVVDGLLGLRDGARVKIESLDSEPVVSGPATGAVTDDGESPAGTTSADAGQSSGASMHSAKPSSGAEQETR
jgi:membrane fusion protein (multidrug efflux system)